MEGDWFCTFTNRNRQPTERKSKNGFTRRPDTKRRSKNTGEKITCFFTNNIWLARQRASNGRRLRSGRFHQSIVTTERKSFSHGRGPQRGGIWTGKHHHAL